MREDPNKEYEVDWPLPADEPRNEPNEPWARIVDDQDEWPGWRERRDDTFA
jgi:hypothetical protein